jgi:hypothetical protein
VEKEGGKEMTAIDAGLIPVHVVRTLMRIAESERSWQEPNTVERAYWSGRADMADALLLISAMGITEDQVAELESRAREPHPLTAGLPLSYEGRINSAEHHYRPFIADYCRCNYKLDLLFGELVKEFRDDEVLARLALRGRIAVR